MDTAINREMLIKYRRYLIPSFLFPSVASCGALLLPKELVSVILFPLFFAVTIYAATPYLSKRASYSYWIMAMGVWICGIIPGILLSIIVSIVFGISGRH